jgi:uncharacterized protein YutE (UPF0331/DUF86 family)
MEEERKKRYNEKLERLVQTVENLNDWTEGIDDKKFEEEVELVKKYGIYHAFQIAVEIIADIAAMTVKDSNIIPKDDYSNLDVLRNKKIIVSSLAEQLKEANGLRNRIVRDYNGLNNKIAYNRILDLLKTIEKFKGAIDKWLTSV